MAEHHPINYEESKEDQSSRSESRFLTNLELWQEVYAGMREWADVLRASRVEPLHREIFHTSQLICRAASKLFVFLAEDSQADLS